MLSESGLDAGWCAKLLLISALTWWECVLASALLSFHLPLLMRTDAIDLAKTRQDFGLLLLPVRRLMVDHAFRLEWVKSIWLTVSSHRSRGFFHLELPLIIHFSASFRVLVHWCNQRRRRRSQRPSMVYTGHVCLEGWRFWQQQIAFSWRLNRKLLCLLLVLVVL